MARVSIVCVVVLVAAVSFANGQSWEKLAGKAVQISARNRFLITGVPAWIVNQQNQLSRWLWRTGTWEKERNDVKNVGAAFDDSAWIVSSRGEVSRYKDGSWETMPGKLVQVSGKSYEEAVGVNSNDEIFHYIRGEWVKLPGAARWASIGEDGEIWVVNSGDQIFRWSSAINNWKQVEGGAKNVDVYNAHRIIVTNSAHQAFKWNGHNGWEKLNGACRQASITAKNIYCVNQAGEIFKA